MEGRRRRPAPSVTACLEPPCRGGEGMGAPSMPAQSPAPTWNLLAARAPATPPERPHAVDRPLPRHRPCHAHLEWPEFPPSGSPGLRRAREGCRPRRPPHLHGAGRPRLPHRPPACRPATRSRMPPAARAPSSHHRDRLVYGGEGRGAGHAALYACTAPAARACRAVRPHAAGHPIPHAASRPIPHAIGRPRLGVVSFVSVGRGAFRLLYLRQERGVGSQGDKEKSYWLAMSTKN
jgi:hypothetical protein